MLAWAQNANGADELELPRELHNVPEPSRDGHLEHEPSNTQQVY
jgi:hypothetical protein